MADPILETIANDIKEVDGIMERGQFLLSAMEDAGEDTKEEKAQLAVLMVRKEKWKRMLQARGL